MLERYYSELLGFFARELRSRDHAADVVHESYARALAQPGLTLSEPRALLYRIARNVIIDAARRRAVEQDALATVALTQATQTESVLDHVESRQRLERLGRQLRAMPRLRRAVFVMVRVHGHTHREAAERLGLSQGAVEQHMVRAVLDLARRAADLVD